MGRYIKISAIITAIIGAIVTGIITNFISIPGSKSNININRNSINPTAQRDIIENSSINNEQDISLNANGSYIDSVGNKTIINNNTTVNNPKKDEKIHITSFKLKKMATCVVKRNTPVPVEFDWSYEGGFDRKELDVRYSWLNDNLANSVNGPNNPLLIMPNTNVGQVTTYIYVKAPNGYVATADCSFFILDPEKTT